MHNGISLVNVLCSFAHYFHARQTPNLRCVSSTARVLVAHYAYVQNRKFLAYR